LSFSFRVINFEKLINLSITVVEGSAETR
jgi:hypothetical protein